MKVFPAVNPKAFVTTLFLLEKFLHFLLRAALRDQRQISVSVASLHKRISEVLLFPSRSLDRSPFKLLKRSTAVWFH